MSTSQTLTEEVWSILKRFYTVEVMMGVGGLHLRTRKQKLDRTLSWDIQMILGVGGGENQKGTWLFPEKGHFLHMCQHSQIYSDSHFWWHLRSKTGFRKCNLWFKKVLKIFSLKDLKLAFIHLSIQFFTIGNFENHFCKKKLYWHQLINAELLKNILKIALVKRLI